MEFLLNFGISIVTLMIAIIGHELMHGFAAVAFGDQTPRWAGRLTLNPIAHIDPVGSILMPGGLWLVQKLAGVSSPILFGWAKPVPVDIGVVVRNGGHFGGVVVAAAGVSYNFLVAFLSAWALLQTPYSLWGYFWAQLGLVNLVLFYFNLIPIPPIDGGRILEHLLRGFQLHQLANRLASLERYGLAVVLLLLFLPPTSSLLGRLVVATFNWMLSVVG